jgi:hypothetical protein
MSNVFPPSLSSFVNLFEKERYAIATLRSIANSSCCGCCQEAKKVATAALILLKEDINGKS